VDARWRIDCDYYYCMQLDVVLAVCFARACARGALATDGFGFNDALAVMFYPAPIFRRLRCRLRARVTSGFSSAAEGLSSAAAGCVL